METLLFYINEALILEKNEIIFPANGKAGKCRIYVGDHGRQRMKERKVSEKEILDAIFGAYKDISKRLEKGEITVAKDSSATTINIIDARKNSQNPVCVSIFIQFNYSKTKLKNPQFIVKTVYKGADYSGALRDEFGKKKRDEIQVFLY